MQKLLHGVWPVSLIGLIVLPQPSLGQVEKDVVTQNPSVISTSADKLKPLEVNCQGLDTTEGSVPTSTEPVFLYDPKQLLKFMQDSSGAGLPSPQDRLEILRFPIPIQ